jgi:predicted small secreted protein
MRAFVVLAACLVLAACNTVSSLKLPGDGWEIASTGSRSWKVCRIATCGGPGAVSFEDSSGNPYTAEEVRFISVAGNIVFPAIQKRDTSLRRVKIFFSPTTYRGQPALALTASGRVEEPDPTRVFALGQTFHIRGKFVYVNGRRRTAMGVAATPARAQRLANIALSSP